MIVIVCFILFFSALAFARGENLQVKGKVTELNFAKKTLTVNKTAFVWDAMTVFYDEKGAPITITADRLATGTLVSIDATLVKSKPSLIKKLYLLPK